VLAEGLTEKPGQATVLLADDFVLLREGLAAICELSGAYRVVGQCADGRCALEMLTASCPDIAVIDFRLPRLFALELIAEAQRLGLRTRLLAMSSQRDRKIAVEVLRAGGKGVLLESDSSREVLLAFEQVLAGGIYLSPAFSLSEVFAQEEPGVQSGDPLDRLSSREYQVFSLLVEGVRAKEIAARLGLSPKTVDTYRASLMKKLDIYHVPGLVRFAMDRELRSQNEHSRESERSGEMPRPFEAVGGRSFAHTACSGISEPAFAPAYARAALSAANGEHRSTHNPGTLNPVRLSH
jgi:DNA-binding NarL/FixJ family response regulator